MKFGAGMVDCLKTQARNRDSPTSIQSLSCSIVEIHRCIDSSPSILYRYLGEMGVRKKKKGRVTDWKRRNVHACVWMLNHTYQG